MAASLFVAVRQRPVGGSYKTLEYDNVLSEKLSSPFFIFKLYTWNSQSYLCPESKLRY